MGRRSNSITVITRDNIRKLRPHEQGSSNGPPVLLSLADLERAKGASMFMSKEELLQRDKKFNESKLQAAENSKRRKEKMEEYDHQRTQNSKLTDIEKEAKEKSNYLLAKAQMQLEEQEDEIKHMNEMMLYAKCVAIRDAQVDEKKMIAKERKDEEARLDAMMEHERVYELKKLDEKEKKRVEELRRGAAKIRQQIEERREAALLEQERKDQETKQILKQISDMNDQDKKEKSGKVLAQRLLMQEVAKANHESTERKRQQKLAEEEEDRKVLEYLLEKERRDIENDKALQQRKAERELELARLRAAQERMSDKQAQQDALRARRAYEAYEREWRRKEKETAERQAQQERELKTERIKQQRAREHTIAVEAHKLRQEFFENLERQKEAEERIHHEEVKKAEKNRIYSQDLKAQISKREQERRKEREDFFKEGVRLAQERMEKNRKIEQIKDRKIQRNQGADVSSDMDDTAPKRMRATSVTMEQPNGGGAAGSAPVWRDSSHLHMQLQSEAAMSAVGAGGGIIQPGVPQFHHPHQPSQPPAQQYHPQQQQQQQQGYANASLMALAPTLPSIRIPRRTI
ncbi:Cilia- and flagella-associated protein 45 [Cladochytrium tenue]|nr:Cilia- and flagella-associated protein 45 [Cladochytrium tenue]